MFILQGERDYQVTMQDFGIWKNALTAHDSIQLKSCAALNHLFISGAGKSTPGEYQTPGNVSAAVIKMWPPGFSNSSNGKEQPP